MYSDLHLDVTNISSIENYITSSEYYNYPYGAYINQITYGKEEGIKSLSPELEPIYYSIKIGTITIEKLSHFYYNNKHYQDELKIMVKYSPLFSNPYIYGIVTKKHLKCVHDLGLIPHYSNYVFNRVTTQ